MELKIFNNEATALEIFTNPVKYHKPTLLFG